MTGLLGGAFDPPHVGHVALADAAQSRSSGSSDVVVVVVADPGHKDVHCPAETRLALARAAFPGREVELDHHARTVDMLRDGRWDDPVFLIGADEFARLPDLEGARRVLELARLGVASRPGYPGALDASSTGLAARAGPLLRDRAVARLLEGDPGASRPRGADRRARAAGRGRRDRRPRPLPRLDWRRSTDSEN